MTKHDRTVKRAALFALGLSIACGAWQAAASAQTLLPRPPAVKTSLAQLQAMPQSNRVVVKFAEGSRVRMNAGRLTGLAAGDSASVARILATHRIAPGALRRLHARPEVELDLARAAGEREAGQRLADLNLYYVIDLPSGVSAATVADALNGLPVVEYAEPGAVPPPPPVDIAPTTPNLKPNQGYLRATSTGVGALNSAIYAGGDGRGINIGDVEYSWQLNHEDLEIASSRILTNGATASDPFNDTNHGTAVLGEIVGRKGSYGVIGIAPGARAWVLPANTSQFGYDPARAIGIATAQFNRGDVILIEQQYWACGFTSGNSYGPLEWLQSVYDAIAAATAKGIIVVEAAGNGGLNLDAAGCNGKFNRSLRNSRAIIVGAGSSTNRSRLSFSSYGSRVDVQGWGGDVTTTAYGDAFNPGDVRQLYTNTFSGTSSASPIVAGAAVAIQGVRRACGLAPLSPAALRNAMVSTGWPQTSPGTGNIGPLPSIRKALLATNARACVLAQD